MKNNNWIGFLGFTLILGTWTAVSWSVIDSDSWLNFLGQLIGAFFVAHDAYVHRDKRSLYMSGAIYFLVAIILLIAAHDFFNVI